MTRAKGNGHVPDGFWSVPGTWAWTTVDAVGAVGLGRQRSPENHSGPHMRQYVRAANISWSGWELSDVLSMNFDPDDFERFRLYPGDVLLNEGSGSSAEVGKSAIWRGQIKDCCFQNTLLRVQPKIVSPEYLQLYFLFAARSGRFVPETQGVNIFHIGKAGLAKFPVPVCPPAEQNRIVSKLNSVRGRSSRARHELDRIPKLIERYKQAILHKAFSGELTADWRETNPLASWSDADITFIRQRHDKYLSSRRGSRLRQLTRTALAARLPSTWLDGNLADAIDLLSGFAFKSSWYKKVGVRLLRGANIAPGRLDWSDEVCLDPIKAGDFATYRLRHGDIVIAMDRPMITGGFKIASVPVADDGALLVQRVSRIRPIPQLHAGYLWYILNSQFFIDHAMSTATGSDLPHISANDILSAPIHLPPLREQEEISRRLDVAFNWLKRISIEHSRAERLLPNLDQAVLSKAFRGELVPQDPNDESATTLLEHMRQTRRAEEGGLRRGHHSQV